MGSLNISVQPFFEWLLRSTIQASLLICLILLLQLMLRGKLGARWCHALWLLLLIRMVMPWAPQSRASIFNLIPQRQIEAESVRQEVVGNSFKTNVQSIDTNEPTVVSTTEVPEDTPEAITATAEPSTETTGPLKSAFFEAVDILPFLWLAGALALAVYVCANNFTLLRIVRRERPLTDQGILELLEDCKAQMDIRIVLGIVATDKVKSAALFGFVRPRLLLPKEMLEALSREELRYVFLHELAHLKRHDIYFGWLMSILQVLHWFNPLVWLAFYRMRADRELACDGLVLARTESSQAKDYGRTVVSLIERFSRARPLPAMAGILETKAQLKRRITMIAQFKKNSYRWSPLAVLLIVIMSCVALPDAVGNKKSGVSWPESEPSISLRRVKVGAGSPLLSPPSLDGRYICDFHWPNVLIRDLVTGEVRPLIDAGKAGAAAVIESRISPNNKYVAYFVVMVNEKNELRLVKMDGTGDRLLYRCENSEWIFLSGWSPDGERILGTLYTSGKGCLVWIFVEDGSMEVIHTPDRVVHNPCLSPDGRYIAYNPPQEKGSPKHDIFIFDIEEQKAESVVQHSAHDKLLGWTPDGNYIFFASDRRIGTPGGRAITDTWDAYLVPVLQGKRNGPAQLVKRNIEGKLVPKGFTRDGSYYYAVEFRAEEVFVAELDLKTGKLLTESQPVSQTGANHVASWSPDGRHLAYCAIHPNLSQTIHIRNLETGQERTLDPNLPPFNSLRWSPDGESLLVSDFDRKSPQAIYRIDVRTAERVALLRSESSDLVLGGAQLSSDQSTLFYTRHDHPSKKTQVIARDARDSRPRDLESGYEKQLLVDEMRTLNLTLSPDGRRLALAFQPRGFGLRILTIPVEGGEPKELLKTEARGMRPAIEWTPDGESLLFWKRGREGNKLWLIPADGGQARQLCDLDLRRTLDVHPDGKRIVFDDSDTRHELWVMENFLPAGE